MLCLLKECRSADITLQAFRHRYISTRKTDVFARLCRFYKGFSRLKELQRLKAAKTPILLNSLYMRNLNNMTYYKLKVSHM